MEEIIKDQIKELTNQRSTLICQLEKVDHNSMGGASHEIKITQQIIKIDTEVVNLLQMIKNK